MLNRPCNLVTKRNKKYPSTLGWSLLAIVRRVRGFRLRRVRCQCHPESKNFCIMQKVYVHSSILVKVLVCSELQKSSASHKRSIFRRLFFYKQLPQRMTQKPHRLYREKAEFRSLMFMCLTYIGLNGRT